MKTLSLVIPVHNEEKNVPLLYGALKETLRAMRGYDHEIIFVDDGSTDTSAKVIAKICERDGKVKLKEFSRNFGKEIATTAGLDSAIGDAVIMLDADMQHPPELLPLFVEKWEHGAEVVVGMRTANTNEGFIKRWGSLAFHGIMRKISEIELSHGETDYRLMDKVVVDAFKTLQEKRRVTRGLVNWLGFKRDYVHFVAPERAFGTASYSNIKLVRLALHSFISNSLLPLRLSGYFGALITVSSLLLGTVVFIERYMLHDPLLWHISGPAQLAILLVFMGGIMLSSIGLIALYIENIHVEVTGRPLYVVRRRENFIPASQSVLENKASLTEALQTYSGQYAHDTRQLRK